MVYKVLWRKMLLFKPGTPGEPILFSISALGSEIYFFTVAPITVYKVWWNKMLPIKPGTPERTPTLSDKCTGF